MSCDPNFNDVVLLLSFDGANGGTVFVDTSPEAQTVTPHSGAALQTTEVKFGSASLLGDGDNYVTVPAGPGDPLDLSGDFTIEGWVLWDSLLFGSSVLFQLGDSSVGNGGMFVGHSSGGQLTVQFIGGSAWSGIGTVTALVSAGTYYHVALVRHGNVGTLYVNGVNVGSQTDWTGTPTWGTLFSVGASYTGSGIGIIGSVDEVRVSAVARYLGNFAAPTEPFPVITCQPVTCDDFYGQVGVLLPLTGPNAGTTFPDDSNNALTITSSGDVQTLNTNGDPWGSGSAADFGSSSAGALDVPYVANGPLDIGGPFTLEFWFRVDPSVTDDVVLADIGDFAGGTGLQIKTVYTAGPPAYFGFQVTPGSNYSGAGWSNIVYNDVPLSKGTWYLLTLVRTTAKAYLAVNGVFDSSLVSNWIGPFLPATKFRFGDTFAGATTAPSPFKGQLSDIRITKNVARYSGVARFAPPSDYYPAGQCDPPCDPAYDSVTSLIQMNGSTFEDALGNTLTVTGSGAVSAGQAIAPNTSSFRNISTGNGNTDYVQVVSADMNAFFVDALEDFTIEVWAYGLTPTAPYPWLLGGSVNQGVTGWWGIQLNPAGGYVFWHGDGFSNVSAAGVWTTGAWNHVAISRTGGFTTVFVNGAVVLGPGGLTSSAFGLADGTMFLGRNNQPFAGDNSNFNGYYQGFRFTKGVGRYTNTPFAPETPNFPDFVCGVQCDDNFADVSTLLTMDGTNGSTSFPDDSNNALAWTSNNGAVVETALVKFGTGALNPNNAGGGFVRTPFVPGGPLDIAAGDFTLEFWFRAPNASSLLGLLNYGNALSSQGFRIYVNSGGLTCQMLLTGWSSLTGAYAILPNVWYHLAVVRKGGEGKLFLNGYQNNAQSMIGAPTITGNVDVGTNQFGSFDGVIDEWRLTKGIARYWDNFMPPQQPFGLVCTGTVPVPDVSGDTLAAATVAIEAVGLIAGTVSYAFDSGTPINLVVETSPVAGTDVLVGSTVDIVLSLGTETTVPNLVGLNVTDATAALTTAGLVLGVITAGYSDTYPVDIIISQDPIAGTSLGEGESVDVVRSLGPTPVEVPNVVTFPFASAAAALAAAGLIVGAVSQAFSEEIELGAVVSQAPSPGATVPPGSAVDLVTSLGPAVVSVPDVLGMTASDASDVLRGAGLRVGVITVDTSGTYPIGTIAAEEPNAGALVPGGTKINLVLSAIAPPFDADATVISQYQQSPTLVQMVEDFAVYIDPRTNLTLFYSLVWNVDTAQGFGLDVWGKIVGVSRLLRIVADDPKFGFDNADTPPPDWEPFGQGRFARGGEDGEAVILPDDAYRILILTKALANIASTSAAAINQLLRNLFPGRGKAFVEDLGGMSMRFVFEFALTPVEYAIVSQSGALPHPAGVSLSVSVPP